MPDFMIAKIRRKGIRLSVCKDQCTNRVEKSAGDEQGNGAHAELIVDRADQKNDDPAHQQKTDIRHQDRNFGEENRFDRNKENRQTPDDSKKQPAGCTVEDG